MIICYDLEDNVIKIFDSYKECAEWFGVKAQDIMCYISKSKKNMSDKKKNKHDNQWYRLFRIEDDDNEK